MTQINERWLWKQKMVSLLPGGTHKSLYFFKEKMRINRKCIILIIAERGCHILTFKNSLWNLLNVRVITH